LQVKDQPENNCPILWQRATLNGLHIVAVVREHPGEALFNIVWRFTHGTLFSSIERFTARLVPIRYNGGFLLYTNLRSM